MWTTNQHQSAINTHNSLAPVIKQRAVGRVSPHMDNKNIEKTKIGDRRQIQSQRTHIDFLCHRSLDLWFASRGQQ